MGYLCAIFNPLQAVFLSMDKNIVDVLKLFLKKELLGVVQVGKEFLGIKPAEKATETRQEENNLPVEVEAADAEVIEVLNPEKEPVPAAFANEPKPAFSNFDYYNHHYASNSWRLGNIFEKKMSLSKPEMEALNGFYYKPNQFTGIEACCEVVARAYLQAMGFFLEQVIANGRTWGGMLSELLHEMLRKEYRYHKGSYNYEQTTKAFKEHIHLSVFYMCEQKARGLYAYRKLADVAPHERNHPKAHALFMQAYGESVRKFVDALPIPPATEAIRKSLNQENPNRWKLEMDILKTNTNWEQAESKQQALASCKIILSENDTNPNLGLIAWEMSKFWIDVDKIQGLCFYAQHLHSSNTEARKPLLKKHQKMLFANPETTQKFDTIVANLSENGDLEQAFASIAQIYQYTPKRIRLDAQAIAQAKALHSKTVDILSQYLEEEPADNQLIISMKTEFLDAPKIPALAPTEIPEKTPEMPATLPKSQAQSAEISQKFAPDCGFSPIQSELLELFQTHELILDKAALESFAKSKKMFKNQLVESINEQAYELLDDLLIEEEEDQYRILPDYWAQIIL